MVLSLQSRLNRYLALLCKPHHIACDGGCRTVGQAWCRDTDEDGRGLEEGTNGSNGSQSTFPETDYSASLARSPADDFLFWGSEESKPINCLDFLVASWCFSSLGVEVYILFFFSERGAAAVPNSNVRNVVRPQQDYTRDLIFKFYHMGGDERYTITTTGGMGQKGRAAARPRTLRGA